MKVAKPSGKLCSAIAIPVMRPARRSVVACVAVEVLGSCGLMSSGTSRSITAMSATPKKKAAMADQSLSSASIDSGRSSTSEM